MPKLKVRSGLTVECPYEDSELQRAYAEGFEAAHERRRDETTACAPERQAAALERIASALERGMTIQPPGDQPGVALKPGLAVCWVPVDPGHSGLVIPAGTRLPTM